MIDYESGIHLLVLPIEKGSVKEIREILLKNGFIDDPDFEKQEIDEVLKRGELKKIELTNFMWDIYLSRNRLPGGATARISLALRDSSAKVYDLSHIDTVTEALEQGGYGIRELVNQP